MQQTPAHEYANGDLLQLIPPNSMHIIEIGCSSGAIAREFKKINPACDYLGVDIDASYAELAKRHCDDAFAMDIEFADEAFYTSHAARDCWIFADVLEHLKDPWKVLQNVRQVLPAHGHVLACIPNVQHWSMLASIAAGEFRYADSGLFDKTHLRWFTRKTMQALFEACGFQVVQMQPRIFQDIPNNALAKIIGDLASLQGGDPVQAIQDSRALQYVIKAVSV